MEKETLLRKSRKLYYYEPYDKQEQFHTSPANCRAIFGGNRSGKTCAGTLEFLFHLTGMYPDWYPEENRMPQPLKGRIICKDFQKGAGEVIVPSLNEWLDDSLIKKMYRNPIGIPVKYTLKNGSVFEILTHIQNTEQYEGWKGHIAWFDEPPPRDKYVATLRGLVDYKGKHWLTLTPLTQPWIYDDIYTKASRDDEIFVVTVDIRDNPYLAEDAIKQFEASLTPDEREARLHGRFMHLSGLVYKEFNTNYHIVEPFTIKKNWTRYMCIDPHPRMPTACVWVAVDEHDNHWVYDELWLQDMNIEQISNAIHAQEGELTPLVRLIDPASDNDDRLAGGFNIRKEFMKYGIYCQKANNNELGRYKIKQSLTVKYNKMMGREAPQQHVMSNCQRTLYEYQHYIYEDRRSRKEEYNQKEKPKDKDNHMMDCLKYLYNHGLRYMPTEEPDEEVVWEGEYTKHPTVKSTGGSSYYNQVERRGGQF